MKFTLTYEGPLNVGGSRVKRIHSIRQVFQKQLRRLWQVNPLLATWVKLPEKHSDEPLSMKEWLPAQFGNLGQYQFLPIVTKALCVECALEFRILRPTDKAGNVSDIDNQIKVLFDALKRPTELSQLPPGCTPEVDESPFHVLSEDDGLITKITSVNDELLQPINGGDAIRPSDVRAFIDVYIRPRVPAPENVIFFSDETEVWDHRDRAYEPLRGLSDNALRARATQCIYRIKALAKSFEGWKANERLQEMSVECPEERYHLMSTVHLENASQRNLLWSTGLRPEAYALKQEMLRRIYGDGPYPTDHGSVAIDYGMLAGVHPVEDAATELELLVRSLP